MNNFPVVAETNNLPNSTVIWRAYIALAVGVLCVAWAAIFVKWAGVPGPASAFYRLLIATLVLLPIQARQLPFRQLPQATLLALLGGVFFALNAALWNSSLLLTSAANATLMANTAPLWVGLGTMFFLGEHLPSKFWLGMATAFAGVSLILGRDLLVNPHFGQGDLLALGAGILYATSLLITQRVRQHLSALTVSTLATSAGVLVILGLCFALNTPLSGYSMQSWLALLGLGLISHIGGVVTINYALGYIRAAITSVTLLGQAVLASFLALLLLGESLGLVQIIGGGLVLGGVYLVHQQK